MAKPFPLIFAVGSIDVSAQGTPCRLAAERFGISASSVIRWHSGANAAASPCLTATGRQQPTGGLRLTGIAAPVAARRTDERRGVQSLRRALVPELVRRRCRGDG